MCSPTGVETHLTVNSAEYLNSQPATQENGKAHPSRVVVPVVLPLQETLLDGCLNSYELTKAAVEGDEGDGNSEPDETPVAKVSEPPASLTKDNELEEGKIGIPPTPIPKDGVQQAWSN